MVMVRLIYRPFFRIAHENDLRSELTGACWLHPSRPNLSDIFDTYSSYIFSLFVHAVLYDLGVLVAVSPSVLLHLVAGSLSSG